MRSASGLAYLVGRTAAMPGTWTVCVVLIAALVLGILVVGHLLPASDPLLLAPLRWKATRLAVVDAAWWG
jgi:hypothetical protein